MTIEQFIAIASTAITADNLIAAMLGGLSFGFLVFGRTAALLRIVGQADDAGTTAFLTAMLGLVFFIPVLTTAINSGDHLWPRVLVRIGFWLLFCVFIGLGIRARVWWRVSRARRPIASNGRRAPR